MHGDMLHAQIWKEIDFSFEINLRIFLKDDIQSNLRMCGKYCLWGAQTNHINVNYMKYLGH